MKRHVTTLVLGAALLGGGCGEQPRERVSTVPASERQATRGSSIVVRGDYAPDERGPFNFHGRYDVSFVQRGAGVNFHTEVPFTAHLEQSAANGPGRRVKLFQAAARMGHTTITAHGPFRVVVDFGDSPYEIRFTAR